MSIFQRKFKYLGGFIFKDGYRVDPRDSIALEKVCTPSKTVDEMRSLLGFLGYCRSYVKNYSVILKPLYDSLKKDITKQNLKEPKASEKKQICQLDSKTKITWTD